MSSGLKTLKKYPQPWNLKEYDDEDIRDRVHNALKHGMSPDRFEPYYKWYKSKWYKRLGKKK